ncbi:GAF domain-containing protein [Microbacterium sp. gxy059]|uniref:GAF domain-containing protein n=1 Tax=Microbacterium sp. gxy059 TaxID=2957199 RepID=UPI003D9742C3
MTSPWIAPDRAPVEFSRSIVERAHDELLAGNDADPRLQQVRPVVRASWGRSLARIGVADALPRLDLSADELDDERRRHPLAGAMDVIRQLLLPGDAAEAGVIVAVGDIAGRLLWVEGDTRLRVRAGDMGFVEGANWSEERVGTSAPGTALALGRAVQVRGPEHFSRLVRPWSCTASPIRDPETRAVLGVLDVTGGDPAAAPQARMLVEATVRAVESELMLSRMRSRTAPPPHSEIRPATRTRTRTRLSVLGRDRALIGSAGGAELSERHSELLLMLHAHARGVTAERLAELVYGAPDAVGTLRPEMVRLRQALRRHAPSLTLESRPYRLTADLDTDADDVRSLLARGAHRVALAAWAGDVLPDSHAPGVVELRERLRAEIREAILSDACLDVLLRFLDTELGADDVEAMRLCLALLPPRSPRRAGIVARLDAL